MQIIRLHGNASPQINWFNIIKIQMRKKRREAIEWIRQIVIRISVVAAWKTGGQFCYRLLYSDNAQSNIQCAFLLQLAVSCIIVHFVPVDKWFIYIWSLTPLNSTTYSSYLLSLTINSILDICSAVAENCVDEEILWPIFDHNSTPR